MAKAVKREVPDNLTDDQKRKMINDWFEREGGYEQLVINSHKTCSDSAMYSREDALAHMLEYFFGLPLEKQWKIYCDGGLEFYITRGLALQVKSSSSSFYHKYRKPLIRERELVNDRGEEFYGLQEFTNTEELEGRMKCLRFLYDNELNMIDKWLVDQKVFQDKKIRHIAEEYGITEADVTRQWNAIKQRLIRYCKSH